MARITTHIAGSVGARGWVREGHITGTGALAQWVREGRPRGGVRAWRGTLCIVAVADKIRSTGPIHDASAMIWVRIMKNVFALAREMGRHSNVGPEGEKKNLTYPEGICVSRVEFVNDI